MTEDPYVPALFAHWRDDSGLVVCVDADTLCPLTQGVEGVGATLAEAQAELLAGLRRRLVGGRRPAPPGGGVTA